MKKRKVKNKTAKTKNSQTSNMGKYRLISEDERQLITQVSKQIGQKGLAERAGVDINPVHKIVHGSKEYVRLTPNVEAVVNACIDWIHEERNRIRNECSVFEKFL